MLSYNLGQIAYIVLDGYNAIRAVFSTDVAAYAYIAKMNVGYTMQAWNVHNIVTDDIFKRDWGLEICDDEYLREV